MKHIHISDLIQDDNNINQSNERGQEVIRESIERLGLGRSIVVDRNGKIIAGNQTTKNAIAAGKQKAIVVETSGDELVVVQRTDLDLDRGSKARELALADNRTSELSYEADVIKLAEIVEEGEINLDWMYSEEEQLQIIEEADIQVDGEYSMEFSDPDEKKSTTRDYSDMGSGTRCERLQPDDEWGAGLYGIPNLKYEMQGTKEDLAQFILWGEQKRDTEVDGTVSLYTDDYRFSALLKNPFDLLQSRCKAVVEPNVSTMEGQPDAMTIWATYEKRWFSRVVQDMGVRIFVDVNVMPGCEDINLIGVPDGWKSYATRYQENLPNEYKAGEDLLMLQFEAAATHAGTEDILFAVFGGRKKVAEICDNRGWVHCPERHATLRNEKWLEA